MENRKLGLGIIAFEGTELIAQIVTEIRDCVDYVVVGFQSHSYTGERCDPNDEKELQQLLAEGIIDNILYIETDHTDFPRVQETEKRNRLVDDIVAHGCEYELIIDSDEFYTHDSFLRAKNFVYDNNIEMSYCRYVNYFHDYTHYLVYPFEKGQYVPFIAKTKYKFAWQCKDFPYPSDPTRRFVIPKRPLIDKKTHQVVMELKQTEDGKTKLVPKMEYLANYYRFEWKELKMHHLSWIRANIRKKMAAWSSKCYFPNYLEIIDKSAERYRHFSEENKDSGAFLLFNTPQNKVDIETFSKQFIFPKIDYKTRTHNEPQDYVIRCEKIRDGFSYDDFINLIDDCFGQETYKGLDDKIMTRDKKKCDYLVISKSEVGEDIKDFVNRLTDDSVIYRGSDGLMILSSEAMAKLRKYARLEWNTDHTWIEGVEHTMREYCEINDLTYDYYFDKYVN